MRCYEKNKKNIKFVLTRGRRKYIYLMFEKPVFFIYLRFEINKLKYCSVHVVKYYFK